MFRPSIHLLAKIVGFRRYSRYTAFTIGIFFGYETMGYLYRFTGRYGIYRPYKSVQYGIDFLDF